MNGFKRFFAAVFVWLSLALGQLPGAAAADLISERAWLEDKSGTLSLSQIKGQEFRPFGEVLGGGIGRGAIWVRLVVQPGLSDQPVVLRIRPAYLDQVELFDPLTPAGVRRVTGDLFPTSDDEFRSFNLGFLLAPSDQARTVYLRIVSTSARFFNVGAFSASALANEERRIQTFSGVYLGISTVFLLWALIAWLIGRDQVLFAFAFAQAFAVIQGFFIFGFGRYLLGGAISPQLLSDLLTFSVLGSLGSALWFYIRFLKEFSPPKIGLYCLQLFMGLAALGMLLLFSGYPRTAVQIIWLTVTAAPVVTFLTALFAKGWANPNQRKDLLPKWMLLTYFGASLLIIGLTVISGLGIIQGSAFTIYGGMTNGLVSGALAVTFLQYRYSLNEKKQALLSTELALSQQLARQESKTREERERLMAMLAHELKNPLAAIQMALSAKLPDHEAHIIRAVSDMSSIIERSVLVERFEGDNVGVASVQFLVRDKAVALIKDLVEPSAVNLRCESAAALTTDEQLFRIVLVNLLENACKYRAQGSFVDCHIRDTDKPLGILITVSNQPGPAGFPDAEKVFSKYYRSPMAHRQSGTGLGLYLVKGLASQLGGDIRYEPSEDKVSFSLWLPR